MALRPRTPVTFTCGHTEYRDLTTRRIGYARWLTTRACTRCRHTHSFPGIPNRRAAEVAALAAWERDHQLPVLRGPAKAVDWARRCRHTTLTAALTAPHGVGAADAAATLLTAAQTITQTSWWIEHRHASPADIVAASRAASIGTRPRRSQ